MAIFDRRVVGHVDRLGDRARDERLRRCHHGDVAFRRKETLALFAAGVGAIEHFVMLFFQVRRPFQGHRATNVIVGLIDLTLGKSKVAQKVKTGVVQLVSRDPKDIGAEFFAQGPLVEHEPNVECRCQGAFDLFQFSRAKTVADKRGVVQGRCVRQCAIPDRIGNDVFDLG